MLDNRPDSRQAFRNLNVKVRQQIPGEISELLSCSFSAFCSWLAEHDQDAFNEAEEIASSNIRVWRDRDDVLRRLWEQVYRR